MIEVADEVQMLRLQPEIRILGEQKSVVSWSGLLNQHQGLDAVLEEINKALKSLIPLISTQRHWKTAARNCVKFMKVTLKLVYFS